MIGVTFSALGNCESRIRSQAFLEVWHASAPGMRGQDTVASATHGVYGGWPQARAAHMSADIEFVYTQRRVPLLPARARKNTVQQARDRQNESDVCPVSRKYLIHTKHCQR